MSLFSGILSTGSAVDDDAAELVAGANHDTVTAKRLTKTNGVATQGYLIDKPVIEYLGQGEQPDYIFTASREAIVIEPRSGDYGLAAIMPAKTAGTFAVITETRVLVLAGHEDRPDSSFSIPYSAITRVDAEEGSGIRGGAARLGTLVLKTADAVFYLPVQATGFGTETPIDAVSYIEQRIGTVGDEEPLVSFKTVCRECREPAALGAKRCPHCQYAPEEKRRGGLYWTASGAATLAMGALTLPIGAYGLYKGKQRKDTADAGVVETVPTFHQEP